MLMILDRYYLLNSLAFSYSAKVRIFLLFREQFRGFNSL